MIMSINLEEQTDWFSVRKILAEFCKFSMEGIKDIIYEEQK